MSIPCIDKQWKYASTSHLCCTRIEVAKALLGDAVQRRGGAGAPYACDLAVQTQMRSSEAPHAMQRCSRRPGWRLRRRRQPHLNRPDRR